MHDYGKATCERNASLLQAASPGDLQCPGFQREALFGARQERVRGLVEQLTHRAVALLGDPARPVEFTRLMAPGMSSRTRASTRWLRVVISARTP